MLTVTIGVIAYNEEKYIQDILDNILAQDYPHELMDIVLVDGLSTDNTKNVMLAFEQSVANEYNRVQIVNNPKRVQPAGWNVVIDNCVTDLLIRIDAHTVIPSDFVTNNVACIESGEDVCGGRRVNIIDNTTLGARIMLASEQAMFGSGIAKYRMATKKEYVSSVAHACYRREVFDKVGNFNEKLLRSEDNELHYRIRKAGYKICLDPAIISEYQTRATLGKMLKQKYGNGKWVTITSVKLSPSIFSIYHFIPLLFVLGIISTTIVAGCSAILPTFALWFHLPMFIMWGAYIALILAMSIISGINRRNFVVAVAMPIVLLLLHLSYGVGGLVGIFKAPFTKVK